MIIFTSILIFIIGAFTGWFIAARRTEKLNREKSIAETKVEEAYKRIDEQKKTLQEAEDKLTVVFKALSGESLKSNNRAFIELAKESFKPMEELLKRYEYEIGEMEKTRAKAYGSLEEQIKSLLGAQEYLQKETGNLVAALRRPEARGRWGEITLKRVVELSGMTEHCDYTEQVSVDTDEGRLRPDMIIHMPGEREVVVDSKVSLDAYISAVDSDKIEDKELFLTKHSREVRKHMRDLAAKSYWSQFGKAPDYVIMFLPGEAFFSAAVMKDHTLIEDGIGSKVLIASPTTLIALLRAIAYGWRQESVQKNAMEIASLGRELYDRFVPFQEHMAKTGSYLSQAVRSFNDMVKSLERRVMVSVRKFREMGVTGEGDLKDIKQVEELPLRECGDLDEKEHITARGDQS